MIPVRERRHGARGPSGIGLGSIAILVLLTSGTLTGVEDARVRETLITKLQKLEADEVVEVLADTAANDPSYATRVAAIEGLAHHEAAEHADLIIELVEFQSQHDQVRRAALTALGKLDEVGGLDPAIQYAAYGYMDRARPAAVEAIGKLAHHDQDRAVEFLLDLLDDPEPRTVRAAGAALAEVGDERAIEPLRALAQTHPNPRFRKDAEKWVEKLEKKGEESEEESEDS